MLSFGQVTASQTLHVFWDTVQRQCEKQKSVELTGVCTDDYDAVFSRLIEVLPVMASVNESHARTMNQLKRHGCHGLGFPDLHNEVFQ